MSTFTGVPSISRRSLLGAGVGAATLAAVGAAGPSVTPAWAGHRGSHWDKLRRRLRGELVLPTDPTYPHAKVSADTMFDHINPAAVVYPVTADDVSTCLLFAQDRGIRITPRSGGHSPAGYSVSTGLVVDMSRMNQVAVTGRTVRVGSGTRQINALTALSPQGLAIAGGLCPTVAVGGFIQGGGTGWLARKYGMASDRLVSAEVVLADGRVVRCSERHYPDLFWALRGGGGGNFGIVTRYEVRPIEISRMANFYLAFPWESAADVLAAWQNWVVDAPPELGSALFFQMLNAAPDAIPEVLVFGSWLGDNAALVPRLDALVSAVGTAPMFRFSADLSYQDAMMQVYGCGELTGDQCQFVGTHPAATLNRFNFLIERCRIFDRPVPRPGIQQMLDAFDADRSDGHDRAIHIVTMGGLSNEVGRRETAYVHRNSQFLVSYSDGLATGSPDPAEAKVCVDWTTRGMDVITPYSTGEAFQNFIDPHLTDWRSAYYAENYPRLVRIKRRYDPYRVFDFRQAIGA